MTCLCSTMPGCSAPPKRHSTDTGRCTGRHLALPRLRAACWLLAAALPIGLHARLDAQPAPRLQAAPLEQTPLHTEPPWNEPLQLSGSPTAPPLEPSGLPLTAPFEMPRASNTAAEAERVRLLTLASQQARRGSRAEKMAATASWQLGLMYLHGAGGMQDRSQAQQWFERAVALGEPLANAGLAWCAIDGCTGAARPATARPWIAKLHAVAPGRADYLEWLLENRMAPLALAQPGMYPREPTPAPHRALLQRAAHAGDIHALIELGFEHVAAGRLLEAEKQFQALAPRSAAAAANAQLLASRRESSTVTPPRSRTPDEWYLEARRYHQGNGVPANYAEAIRLYQIAAAGGSATARRMLALIYSRPAPDGGVDIAWMQQLAQMDVSQDGRVVPMATAAPVLLQREPTPLYDLMQPAGPKPLTRSDKP